MLFVMKTNKLHTYILSAIVLYFTRGKQKNYYFADIEAIIKSNHTFQLRFFADYHYFADHCCQVQSFLLSNGNMLISS